jgi:hypothetical protein
LFYVDNFWGFLPLSALGPNPGDKALKIFLALQNFLNELKVPFHEHFFGQTFEAIGWNFGTTPAPWIGFKPVKRRLALAVLEWLPQQAQLDLKPLQQVKGLLVCNGSPQPCLASDLTSQKSKPSKQKHSTLATQ